MQVPRLCPPGDVSRNVMASLGFFGAAFAALNGKAWAQEPVQGSFNNEAIALPTGSVPNDDTAEVRAVKIARAMRAGPRQITENATIAEMDRHGNMTTILRHGTNDWVCTPGKENRIGDPSMCVDRLGCNGLWISLRENSAPPRRHQGCVTCFAGQPSTVTPTHLTRPRNSSRAALDGTLVVRRDALWSPNHVRDAGASIMFAGTPYAYLQICGSLWVGNSYSPGDQAVWSMQYAKQPAEVFSRHPGAAGRTSAIHFLGRPFRPSWPMWQKRMFSFDRREAAINEDSLYHEGLADTA
jgi:hypothetical protein